MDAHQGHEPDAVPLVEAGILPPFMDVPSWIGKATKIAETVAAMNSRCKIVLFATLVVTVALLVYDRQPKEPVYEGRPLSEWLEDFYREGGETNAHSAEALRQMEPDAVPHLRKMLRARDSWPKRKLMELASKQQLVPVPLTPASSQIELALHGCAVLGQDARDAIPEIVTLLPERDGVGRFAALILARTWQEGVLPLAAGLTSSDQLVRHNCARGLVGCRFDGSAAVPGLITLLDDPDADLAQAAASALGSIRQKPELAVPALILCVKRRPPEDRLVRAVAAAALRRFGDRAREAVPSLLELVHDRSPAARHASAKALAEIDPDAADRMVPDLLVKLETEEGTARIEAARTLASMRLQPARIVPALMKRIPDPDPAVSEAVMYALSHFGGEAQSALPALLERCEDANTSVSTIALFAVSQIDPRQAVPTLRRQREGGSCYRSDEAARQLGTFGPAAAEAVPELLAAFRKGDEYSRTVILEALKKINPEAARTLHPQVTDPRQRSLTRLNEIGARVSLGGEIFTKPAITGLLKCVNDYQVRHPVMKGSNRNWERGTWHTGVMAAYQATGDQTFLDQALRWSEEHQWQHGTERSGGNILTCTQTYLELHFVKTNRAFIEPTIQWLNSGRTNTPSGAPVWYLEGGRRYADSLYVGAPPLAMLARATGDHKYTDWMNAFFWDVHREIFDEAAGLFYRDKRFIDQTTANGRKVLWSRGNGWAFASLPRILTHLPPDDPGRAKFVALFKQMAASIAKRQGADGFWRPNLDDPEQFPMPESSGTGFFCYGLAWGVRNGLLDRDAYLPVVKQAWAALAGCVSPEGKVQWGQLVGDRGVVVKQEDSHEYVTGTFLLAGSEVLRLVQADITRQP